MAAKYILALLAVVFLVAGAYRRLSGGSEPQARAWLLVGVIFSAVSLWLFTRG